jgi:methionyl-tRNA synthetase
LTISQLIQSKLEEFEGESELKYEKLFYDEQSKCMTDIRDLIKECPHCNTIWMKTVGCHNVVCGSKIAVKDFSSKKVLKYNFQIRNGKIMFNTELYKDNPIKIY